MTIKKRNGELAEFDKNKIIVAVASAFLEVDQYIYEEETLNDIADDIEAYYLSHPNKQATVEEVQDMIEEYLMMSERKDVARAYIRYRYKKEILRQTAKTYKEILDLVELNNEELKEENSNKNAIVASTQRDYMAGEVSKDLSHRMLLPAEIVRAHDAGEIHFHDMDYYAQHIHNCCLVNLEDMLQNGTVINKTMIERPHSFATACNIATQIMAVVASGQYGGQSVSLSHLAPFVDVSRQKIREDVIEELRHIHHVSPNVDYHSKDKIIYDLTERRVREEVRRGVQTIQYQINTLNTSNGQTPFVTVFMYLGEVEDPTTKADLAMIIEEVLKQRIEGVKNEKGVFITPAFPKLIYTLEKDNITEDSPYWYLTELAAKCTAKRLVPDYISEKVMKELKLSTGEKPGEGDVYTCMGCRSFLTPDRSTGGFGNIAKAKNYTPGKPKYYGRLITPNQGV